MVPSKVSFKSIHCSTFHLLGSTTAQASCLFYKNAYQHLLPVRSLQAIFQSTSIVILLKCKFNYAVPSRNCSQGPAWLTSSCVIILHIPPGFSAWLGPSQPLWHPPATVAFLQLLKCAMTLCHMAFESSQSSTCNVVLPLPHFWSQDSSLRSKNSQCTPPPMRKSLQLHTHMETVPPPSTQDHSV